MQLIFCKSYSVDFQGQPRPLRPHGLSMQFRVTRRAAIGGPSNVTPKRSTFVTISLMKKTTRRALLSARSKQLRTSPGWICAFADFLSLLVSIKSRSLHRQIGCLSHLACIRLKAQKQQIRPAIESKIIAIHNNAKKCIQIGMVSWVLYPNRKPALLRALYCGITRVPGRRQIVTYENIRLGVRAKDSFPGRRLSRASEWQSPELWRTKIPAGTSLFAGIIFLGSQMPLRPFGTFFSTHRRLRSALAQSFSFQQPNVFWT
jgi:hypothetical protein